MSWFPAWVKPYVYWGISVACFLVHLSIQVSSGMLVEQLSRDFNLDSISITFLLGMVFYPNICLQIPAGMVTDRFGARRVLGTGAFVCAIGAWGFSGSQTYTEACLYRLVMGAGLSFSFVSMAYLIANWMRRESFSMMFSVAEMIALFSSVVCMRYLSTFLEFSSWRDFTFYIAYMALFLSIVSFVFIRDKPHYLEDESPSLSFLDILGHLRSFVADYQMWANGAFSGLLFANLSCFVAIWGPTFLSASSTISLQEAASMCSTLTLGLVVGCPLIAIFLPRINNIHMVLSLSALTASISMSIIVVFPLMDAFLIRVLLFVCGLSTVVYLVPFTITNYYVRPGTKSTAIGFTNLLSTIFGPTLSVIIGFMVEHHRVINGLESYSLSSYQYGMNVLPMVMFLAALLCFFAPNTHRAGGEYDF
ncbi:MFS transporter [Candidatus Comchoanobacter bicostacola]|uniref:Lysosomal dipeptide transporter MFSD1 n=1 Tax=Candidatus Comchoanobacter bicostacola TaxID=2919598 RepID=A0ABY5DJW7_9GAMM|nr:MFS transporter [Candidatus Comchoanobacter bicostacola]UTC24781.1 MFS transporter [Candidatus Comchoanobacter bicostacola]